MDIKLRTTWSLELSPDEWRLVSRALRGELAEADRGHALELQRKAIAQRATALRAAAREAEIHDRNANG